MKQFTIVASMLAALAAGAASPAHAAVGYCDGLAANIVLNCGFEYGNLSGWNLIRAASGTGQQVQAASSTNRPDSGNDFWLIAATGGIDDTIAQTLPTVSGTAYIFAFFEASDGLAPNHFSASWDGATLLNVNNAAASGYTFYEFNVTGTGSDTISFSGSDTHGALSLDDVYVVPGSFTPVVTAVPEPAAASVLGCGLLGLTVARRRRR